MIALFHQAVQEHLSQQSIADKMQAVVNNHIALMLGIQLIIAPFSVGLTCGASAYAYKALTAKPTMATPQP
jgi:hypothetical protein